MDRKSIYIVILSITTIIAACFAIYFGVTKNNSNITEKDKEKNNIISTSDTQSKNEGNTLEDSDTSSKTETIVQTQIVKEPTLVDAASNLDSDHYLLIETNDAKLKIKGGNAYVSFTYKKISFNTVWNKELNTYYEIENVPGKVVDGRIYTNVGSGEKTFVLLLEDGTVCRTKYSDGNSVEYIGKIDGCDDIVKIDSVASIYSNSEIGSICVTDKNGQTKVLDMVSIVKNQ